MTVISVFISGVICRAKATLIIDNKVFHHGEVCRLDSCPDDVNKPQKGTAEKACCICQC